MAKNMDSKSIVAGESHSGALTSAAATDQQIEIFDRGVSIGYATVNGNVWSKEVSGLSPGPHNFTAKGVGGNPSSNPWAVSVQDSLPEGEDFESVGPVILAVGQSVETPKMKITLVAGEGNIAIQTAEFGAPSVPGKVDGKVLHVNFRNGSAYQKISIDLKSICSVVRFWHAWVDNWGSSVSYWNQAGVQLGLQQLAITHIVPDQVSFSAPGIARIEIETVTKDWFAIDRFTFG